MIRTDNWIIIHYFIVTPGKDVPSVFQAPVQQNRSAPAGSHSSHFPMFTVNLYFFDAAVYWSYVTYKCYVSNFLVTLFVNSLSV